MPFFLTPSDDKAVMQKGRIAPVRSTSRGKSNQKPPTRQAVMSCENRQIFPYSPSVCFAGSARKTK